MLKGHSNKVSAVAFSPRGRYCRQRRHGQHLSALWDATTGQSGADAARPQRRADLPGVGAGRPLPRHGRLRQIGEALDRHDRAAARAHRPHRAGAAWPSFSPDGKYILSCSGWPQGDKTLRLWDAKTGKEMRQFEGHTGADRLRRLLAGRQTRPLRQCGQDGSPVGRGDGQRAAHVARATKPRSASVAISPDGRLGGFRQPRQDRAHLGPRNGPVARTSCAGTPTRCRAVAFTPDGKRLVSGSRDHTVRVWDVDQGAELKRIELPDNKVDRELWSCRPTASVSPSPEAIRRCVLVDLETGKQVRQFDGHDQDVTRLACSPDGKTLLSGSYDRTARLWDVETGRELHVFRGHRNWVWSVDFSPDGRRIVTAGGGAGPGGQLPARQRFRYPHLAAARHVADGGTRVQDRGETQSVT